MVGASKSPMPWLVIIATLVAGPAAYCEPAHLACEGAVSEMRVGTSAGDEKYLVSLAIDLNARTVKVEGHSSVPIKGPVDA